MLNKAKVLKGYKLNSKDGEIGVVKEFYFDDRFWAVRYLVAQTGDWMSNKQVLISPHALKEVIREDKNVVVELTKKQIEGSPSWESDKPVSRQFENAYFEYYGWPVYWGGPFMWGNVSSIQARQETIKEIKAEEKAWNPHLRSTQAVTGYHIQAKDGEIGHVDDFIIDDVTWAIRYLVIDTGDWLPGKKVLISPKWMERVSYDESKVYIGLTRDDIKNAPEYTDDTMPNRDYETRLHMHYKRQGYWEDKEESDVHVG